jgi:thiamine biosynthesis lipoprotein
VTTPISTRREFLTGQAAADALAELASRAGESAEEGSARLPTEDAYQLRLARRAMACQFEVVLNAGQYEQGPEGAMAALDLVDALEDQLTVFRDSSEMAEINRSAAEGPVLVESRLFELLQLAQELYELTEGAFDITSGPLTKAWGFYRRQGAIPAPEALAAARQVVGSRLFELDADRQTIRFARPGVELNLGSIGKGYALDRCAEVLAEHGIEHYLLHGGKSSVLAHGSRAGGEGWPVALADPLRPGKQLGTVTLRNRAMATSGAAYQFFRHQGKRYGHILDPRTGWPAEGVLSCTVLAPTAAQADALSTAFYVLGPQRALEICRRRAEIGLILATPAATHSGIEIHRANLGDEARF